MMVWKHRRKAVDPSVIRLEREDGIGGFLPITIGSTTVVTGKIRLDRSQHESQDQSRAWEMISDLDSTLTPRFTRQARPGKFLVSYLVEHDCS